MSIPNSSHHAALVAKGWNTWNTRSVLSHVLMPEALALNLSLCHYGLLTTVTDAFFGSKPLAATAGVKLAASEIKARILRIAPGAHAFDGSYTNVSIVVGDLVVEVETAGVGEKDLVVLVKAAGVELRPPSLIVEGAFLWNHPGSFEILTPRSLRAKYGGGEMLIHCTEAPADEPYLCQRFPSWVLTLDKPTGLSTSEDRTVEEISMLIQKARDRECATHKRYGAAAERHAALQACLAWNTTYEPSFDRIVTTPGRKWNVDRLGYGIFCWDSFFQGWLMASDDIGLARNCVREVFREMVDGEFVPNVVNGSGRRSLDRSQPCIGGIGVLAMHEMAPDLNFLREVWPSLLAWNRWWDKARRNRLGSISPGSHPAAPRIGDLAEFLQPDTLKGAKLETGLDNTPMYDDVPFDHDTHLMSLADVGLTSLYVLDCQALAILAREMGQKDEALELDGRGAKYQECLRSHWNEKAGIFQNRLTETGAFNPRTSPTCFFPMLTGTATPGQVATMLQRHLLNPKEYWGDWVLPSVPLSDPAYPEQHYWRGRVWAPLNFLVYLGLKRAGCHEEAAELTRRSVALFDRNWRERKGLFENFSAITGEGGDVVLCDPMCSWTGLLVLMELMENGTIPLPSLFRGAVPRPA